ncbi:SUKH-4 family immunity protein [Paucisalibacillus globulus]|uniref:SUKH-4 family immunity protein n=1 Tax=Paucisalibacillus globulus TaxID=351095 RepID=UPI000410A6E3|nr:SUKH-4 family immunity protein [Paucisalibacillus globulus]
MIKPEEFNNKWDINKDGPLITFNEQELIGLDFSDELKKFLTVAGLPETPPPYLEFTSSEGLLRPVTSVFNMPESFQRYWFLGSTGSGDPICLIEEQETVVFLHNSDNYKEVYINSSLNQFAECILVYSKMIDKAIEVNGEDAFIDNDIPNSVINWLKEELVKIDGKCLEEGSFWAVEVENLFE